MLALVVVVLTAGTALAFGLLHDDRSALLAPTIAREAREPARRTRRTAGPRRRYGTARIVVVVPGRQPAVRHAGGALRARAGTAFRPAAGCPARDVQQARSCKCGVECGARSSRRFRPGPRGFPGGERHTGRSRAAGLLRSVAGHSFLHAEHPGAAPHDRRTHAGARRRR